VKVTVGQPVSKPHRWVVNLSENDETTTIRTFTGPKAERLALWFGRNLAAEQGCELVKEG